MGAFLLRARREGLRDFGACMSPHTAWLILQGIETLPLRMERHMAQHAQGGRVPGRAPVRGAASAIRCWNRIPSHALAQKLLPRGRGLGVQLRHEGQPRAGQEVHRGAQAVQPPGQRRRLPLAGDPPGQHHALPHERRGAAPAPASAQGTIRLSIGLEDPDDLIDDLKRALKAAEKAADDGTAQSTAPDLLLHGRQAVRRRPSRPWCSSTACSTTTASGSCRRATSRNHGWNVLAPDLPGPLQERAASRRARWRKARDFIARRCSMRPACKQAALVGHSFGSLIALEAAARAPERVIAPGAGRHGIADEGVARAAGQLAERRR